jgi:choice-of-anchor C domain-containing protein
MTGIPAYADLLVNGSFENSTFNSVSHFVDLPGGNTDITGWTATLLHIDYVDSSEWQAADGRRSLDLEGSACAVGTPDCAGGIEQSFATVAGQQYEVTFDMAGNPVSSPIIKTMLVSAAGQQKDFTFDITGHTEAVMGWTPETWTFTASAATTTLEFATADGNQTTGFGPALDNVAVNAIGTQAVPEPGSWLLLGGALVGLAASRRNFRKQ